MLLGKVYKSIVESLENHPYQWEKKKCKIINEDKNIAIWIYVGFFNYYIIDINNCRNVLMKFNLIEKIFLNHHLKNFYRNKMSIRINQVSINDDPF